MLDRHNNNDKDKFIVNIDSEYGWHVNNLFQSYVNINI